MPTYTYACTECGHAFDIRQSFTDEPLTDCPVCADGAGRLRKVIHPVGIAFKGSGFYKTDSRSSGGSKGATAKGEGAASGSSSESGSSSKGSGSGSDSGSGSGSPARPHPRTGLFRCPQRRSPVPRGARTRA